MKIALFSNFGFLPYIIKHLEKDGHSVIFNRFSPDIKVCIIENHVFMYYIYRNLKIIKKNKIKLINLINDIPVFRLQKYYPNNTKYKTFLQILYHVSHRNQYLFDKIEYYKPNPKKSRNFNYLAGRVQTFFNTRFLNRFFYQKNYRRFLKNSDLNLSISKFTQKVVKKFLNLDTKVCYQCVNSDYLLSLPRTEIKYDAINISRITRHKRQEVFVEAANKLGLNILVLGSYTDFSVKLNCPHFYLPDHEKVMNILNQTKFYVDASEFEGFGMTPVEAAFLDKISIVSNTCVHKEVLGDYPIYFKKNNVDDLVEKMKIVMDGEVRLNNKKIKQQYTSQALKNRIMKHIESLF